MLDGSAGGHWLDLSAAGLAEVGYIRFSVPDDADAETSLNIELDAVSINGQKVGDVVPEPATMSLLAVGALATLRRRKTHT